MKRSFMKRLDVNTLLFLAPWALTLVVFWLYPLGYALYLSFTKYYTLRNEAVFVGLSNYAHILHDSFFWQAFQNTALFSFGTIPFTTALALFLAVILHSTPRLQGLFRATMFLPSVTSLIVLALIFSNIYASDGYLTAICRFLHVPFPVRGWLQDQATALPSIMAMDVLIASGYYMVLFLAALQSIPHDLHEAAALFGATAWQQFWHITLPMLRPTVLFVLVVNTIRAFQIFVEIYVMTRGGPLGSTTTLIYSLYANAFDKSDMMGYACALAYIVFVIILLFSLAQMWLLRANKAVGD